MASGQSEAGALNILPPRGTLGKSVRLRSGRVVSEEQAVDRMATVLLRELEAYDAPVLDYLETVRDKEKAHRALMGRLRVSTVTRYLAYRQRFRMWASMQYRQAARINAMHLVDYLTCGRRKVWSPRSRWR